MKVSSSRSFVISGYINTSHGKVTTTVSQSVSFANNQSFDITGTQYLQDISQSSLLGSHTTVSAQGSPSVVYDQNSSFPLTLDISEVTLANGDINQTTTVKQTDKVNTSTTEAGTAIYTSTLVNTAQHVDTLEFDSSFNLLGNTGQSGSQQYDAFDSAGTGYDCTLAAAANVLTSFGPGCVQ